MPFPRGRGSVRLSFRPCAGTDARNGPRILADGRHPRAAGLERAAAHVRRARERGGLRLSAVVRRSGPGVPVGAVFAASSWPTSTRTRSTFWWPAWATNTSTPSSPGRRSGRIASPSKRRPGCARLPDLLVSDRNRVEFRWVSGEYSTRYRNRLTVERDFLIGELHVAPYASAEVFYEGAKHWYEEQYAAGLQLPYRRSFKFSAYYLRQNCTTCSPAHLNVVGMTVDVYLGSGK